MAGTNVAPTTEAKDTWCWKQTPNPAQMILAVFVESDLITLVNKPTREIFASSGIPYALPSTFAALDPRFSLEHLASLDVPAGTPTIDQWYFIGESIGPSKTAFYFFPPSTNPNPVPYDSTEIQGNHHWDIVVYDIWTETDQNFNQSSNYIAGNDQGFITAPTVYIKDDHLPDIDEGTIFNTDLFISALRPVGVRHKVPIPEAMRVQVNGAERFFPKCIHPDIYVGPTRSGSQTFLTGAGTGGTIGGTVAGANFAATNVTDRKPYFLSDDYARNQYGLWERKRVKVTPPKKRDSVTD